MKIKIIGIPPGFASEEIRMEWIDLEFESLGRETLGEDNGNYRAGTENLGGYRVKLSHALEVLKQNKKEKAYEYWSKFTDVIFLIFKKEICKEM
jgi:hypothetical protein